MILTRISDPFQPGESAIPFLPKNELFYVLQKVRQIILQIVKNII